MKSVLEKWKAVPGYDGWYQVSNYGAVRSLKFGKVKYLRNTKTPKGYECIDLYRESKKKMFRIHRLVWEAFVGPIPDGYEIDHINTVRDDNRLDNLRCVTPKENNANPITAERNREAQRKACNKPVLQLDKVTGEVIQRWECAADVERELGINNRNISACCLGNRNSSGGFKWKFA